MHKTGKIYTIVIVLVLTGIAGADSISLGSVSDIDSITLNPGEQGVFRLYFFNMGNEPIDVNIKADYPSDLRVEIHPQTMTIEREITRNPSSDGEWFILADGMTFVRLHRVDVYVKIPSGISTNLYKVKLSAVATRSGISSMNGITQSLAQVRETTLKIYVPGTVRRTREDSNNNRIYVESPVILEEQSNWTFGQITGGGAGTQPTYKPDSIPSETTTTLPQYKASDDSDKYRETAVPGVYQDNKGRVKINLPTGNIVIDKEQKETALDLGLVTLVISVASLILRILK